MNNLTDNELEAGIIPSEYQNVQYYDWLRYQLMLVTGAELRFSLGVQDQTRLDFTAVLENINYDRALQTIQKLLPADNRRIVVTRATAHAITSNGITIYVTQDGDHVRVEIKCTPDCVMYMIWHYIKTTLLLASGKEARVWYKANPVPKFYTDYVPIIGSNYTNALVSNEYQQWTIDKDTNTIQFELC